MACANPASPLQLSITNNTVTEDGASSARGIAIGLGNPQQVLSLLPAVADSDLFIFNAADCGPSTNDSCIAEKGGVFNPKKSRTYVVTTESQWNGTQEPALSEGSYIYFNDELRFGSDGLSYGFPAFLNQPGYGSQAGLPLGANSTFVRAVYEAGKAPSQVWGLWPGTRNIYEPVDGLLVIGGYDTSRVNGDWVEFPTYENCATCVVVEELTYTWEGGSTSLLANSSDSLRIGLEPFAKGLDLPQYMFENFAAASRGTYDPDLQLLTYDINNPPTGNISVTLSNGYQTTMLSQEIFSKPRTYNSEGVYAIKDDSVIISVISNDTESGYVASWGMPFLTMNYILMDYDNQQFKMAPAIRGDSSSIGNPVISTICGAALPTSSSNSSTNGQSPTPTPTPHRNHTGAIVGGVVGGVLGIALILCGLGYVFWRSSRKNRAANRGNQQTHPPAYVAQSQGPNGSGNAKPAVSEFGDQRMSVWTNSAPTEYSELATPQQGGTEFSQNSQVHGWLQKPGPINEEVSLRLDCAKNPVECRLTTPPSSGGQQGERPLGAASGARNHSSSSVSPPAFPPPPTSPAYPPPPSQASPGLTPNGYNSSFLPPPPPGPSPGLSQTPYPLAPIQNSASPPPLKQPTAQRPYNYGAVPASAPAHQTSFSHNQIAMHQRQPSYNESFTPPPPFEPGTTIPEDEKIDLKPASKRKQQLKAGVGIAQAKLGGVAKDFSQAVKPLDGPRLVGVPEQGNFAGVQGTFSDDVGTFNGGSFRVSHRDTNSIITLQLAMGCPITAKPGAMIAMSPSITLKGAIKFSVKKLLIGGEMAHSTFTGPGELLLAPSQLGDLAMLRMGGDDVWSVGRDAFLACTQGVTKEYKSQSFSKAMFSGEGLFVYRIAGTGILWFSSFGAILKKELVEGERYIVDNGHLVAWNCKYVLERVASGGIISGLASGEGLVCKFTGPGTVYMQTRNPVAFSAFINNSSHKEL
ncbi:hypothetical protein DV736_g930, partial [Chaetothyriales sp. CBS 134916]